MDSPLYELDGLEKEIVIEKSLRYLYQTLSTPTIKANMELIMRMVQL